MTKSKPKNPLKAKVPLEEDTKKAIKKYFTQQFPTAWDYMPPGGAFGKSGVPDHLYCVPVVITQAMVGRTMGMFVSVEAKRPTGKPSPAQLVQLNEIRQAGGVAGLVYNDHTDINKMHDHLMKYFDLEPPCKQ